MLILYDFGIKIYYLLIIVFQHFNPKARFFIQGRQNLLEKIASKTISGPSVWFHFASLGEFEQGRPVVEKVRLTYPKKTIVITFFSPSGYELRKNYSQADHIFYLPLDTKRNAKAFVNLINPEVAIFTKYEFWYHYMHELRVQNIPVLLISGIFRDSQPFFKWYGGFNRKILGCIDHFFVQDEHSKELLRSIDISNVTVSGDTRFDRVIENASRPKVLPDIQGFCGDSKTFVAGSTWPADEKLISRVITVQTDWKFIIAPHEIKEEKIRTLLDLVGEGRCIRFSELNTNGEKKTARVLVLDTIGILSSVYQFADISYIGGGFGVGIHNTLEAAAYGVPVIFGPEFRKFREAKRLIELGAGFTISNFEELESVFKDLVNEDLRAKAGKAASLYVQNEKGATSTIMTYLQKIIQQ